MVLAEILGKNLTIKYMSPLKKHHLQRLKIKLPFHSNETAICSCGVYSSSFVCSSYAFSSLD